MGTEITVIIQWVSDPKVPDDSRFVVAANAYNLCPSCGKASPAYGYFDKGFDGMPTTMKIWDRDLICPHCKDRHALPMKLFPCPLFRGGGPLA